MISHLFWNTFLIDWALPGHWNRERQRNKLRAREERARDPRNFGANEKRASNSFQLGFVVRGWNLGVMVWYNLIHILRWLVFPFSHLPIPSPYPLPHLNSRFPTVFLSLEPCSGQTCFLRAADQHSDFIFTPDPMFQPFSSDTQLHCTVWGNFIN